MGSQAAAGQMPAARIVPLQKSVAPAISVFRAESNPLLAPPSRPSQDRENFLAHTSLRFPGPDERAHGLEQLSPVVKLRTVILTQVSLPLVQLWDGKLELDAFQSTLRIQNLQFGPLGNGAMLDSRLPQQDFPNGLRSIRLAGLSLKFHFGRVGGTRRPTQAWKCVPRIVAVLLN